MSHPQIFNVSLKSSKLFEADIPVFPKFLPFNQIMQHQRLCGIFLVDNFIELSALGIRCQRLRLFLEFEALPSAHVKVFGEMHLTYERDCKICSCTCEKMTLIPFSFLLLSKNRVAKAPSQVEFLNPDFLSSNHGQDGLPLEQIVEHFILRALPFSDERVACLAHAESLAFHF